MAEICRSDTAPLVARVLESWEQYAAIERIVLLDDALDVAKIAADLRDRGKKVPAFSEVERKVLPWSRALSTAFCGAVEVNFVAAGWARRGSIIPDRSRRRSSALFAARAIDW